MAIERVKEKERGYGVEWEPKNRRAQEAEKKREGKKEEKLMNS